MNASNCIKLVMLFQLTFERKEIMNIFNSMMSKLTITCHLK